ncbi:MAG: type III PLP-dependent enzyme, partial [Planctomycetaceae bacterium]
AMKANSDPLVLGTLRDAGAAVDVCSASEMHTAFAAGFKIEEMIHTHPCKSDSNLRECYEKGIRWFVYDNQSELDKFVRLAPLAQLMLRVAVSARSSALNLSCKFGASEAEAMPLLLEAQRKGLQAAGVSIHVGSQCVDPSDYDGAFATLRSLYDRAMDAGIGLTMIDIGGGFPAPYRDQSLMSLADYCDVVRTSLQRHLGDLPVRLIAEPGRVLCAQSVTLVTKVIGKSRRDGMTWYFVDDGIYGAFSAKRAGHTDFDLIAENPQGLETSPCVVAGPTCDSGDILYRDHPLPDLQIGDLLLVPTMGAYTSASACYFNGLPPPRSIAVE